MNKVIISILLLGLSSYSADNDCHESYIVKVNPHSIVSPDLIPGGSLALKSVVDKIKPTHSELQIARKNYSRAQPKETSNKKFKELEALKEGQLSAEVAEVYLKKLIKSGFILGPIHETIFGRSMDFVKNGFSAGDRSYFKKYEIDTYKSRIDQFSDKISQKNEAARIARREFAEKMYITFEKMLRVNGTTMTSENLRYQSLSYQTSYLNGVFDSSSYNYNNVKTYFNTSAEKTLPSLYAILEVKESPGSKEFLINLFENSLNEIIGNLRTRSTSKIGAKIGQIGSFIPGVAIPAATYLANMTGLIQLNPGDLSAVSVGSVGIGGVVGYQAYNIYQYANESSKNAWIKVKNIVKKRTVSSKVIKSLNDESNDPVAKELAKIENSEDVLDLDFSAIKFEIQKELNNITQIPQWGNELSKGVSNISLRINLLLDQYQENVKKMDPMLKKAMITQAPSNLNIKTSTTNNELVKMKFFKLLVDIQAVKTDTLALSMALDQYIAKAKEQKEKNSSEVSRYFFDDKLGHLLREIEILKATAEGISKIETQLVQNIDTLNVIFHSQDINVIMGLEDRLKIE